MLNHKQVIIYSFKYCAYLTIAMYPKITSLSVKDKFSLATFFTIAMDDSEDLLLHFLKPNQPCAAGQDWLKGLYYIVVTVLDI